MRVSGISLDPVKNSLFEKVGAHLNLKNDLRIDIRDKDLLKESVKKISPDIVIHFAAQPLVRKSYLNPRETIETNVMGTFNLLESIGQIDTVKACLVITTDKVYKNINQKKGYLENDALGGEDPYSASKAMADIVTQSYLKSFKFPPTAIARAGNVIGGGDVSENRLIPDLLRGFASNQVVDIRYPQAVRPWQHVLDCLNGYKCLLDEVLKNKIGGEWNFGPDESSFKTVEEVAKEMINLWGDNANWKTVDDSELPEAELLALDATKAQKNLNWRNKLNFHETLKWTVQWQKEVNLGKDPYEVTLSQIRQFQEIE